MLITDRARAVADALGDWTGHSRPLYAALADALAAALRTRRVPTHLPSERALAAVLHVSRGTVASAYELLRERDLLQREQGSGSVARPSRAHEICADPLECVRLFFADATGP